MISPKVQGLKVPDFKMPGPKMPGLKMKAPRHQGRRYAAGFTLIEVMIALAIVSTALPALILLVMAQLDGAAHVREKTYAMWIAENELTRLNILNTNKELFPTYKLPQKDSGNLQMMGLQWQWVEEANPSEEMPILIKIDIAIKLVGVAEGSGYNGIKDTDNLDPVAVLTGYLSE